MIDVFVTGEHEGAKLWTRLTPTSPWETWTGRPSLALGSRGALPINLMDQPGTPMGVEVEALSVKILPA